MGLGAVTPKPFPFLSPTTCLVVAPIPISGAAEGHQAPSCTEDPPLGGSPHPACCLSPHSPLGGPTGVGCVSPDPAPALCDKVLHLPAGPTSHPQIWVPGCLLVLPPTSGPGASIAVAIGRSPGSCTGTCPDSLMVLSIRRRHGRVEGSLWQVPGHQRYQHVLCLSPEPSGPVPGRPPGGRLFRSDPHPQVLPAQLPQVSHQTHQPVRPGEGPGLTRPSCWPHCLAPGEGTSSSECGNYGDHGAPPTSAPQR